MKNSLPLFSMEGRTALVTGATGHLGRPMTLALARAGAHVLVNSRSIEAAKALVAEIRTEGGTASSLVFDVGRQGEIEQALDTLCGPLHVLVNNAYAGGGGSIERASPQAYRDSYEISLIAAHRLLQAALPSLRMAVEHDGDASVINIASMYGVVSPDLRLYASRDAANPPFYGAAKAALIQWTRYAACELGAQGIRVNSISPGPFPSDSVQNSDPDFVARLIDRVPLGRIGRPDEMAGPLMFLASRASIFVTGANLAVDGGWTAW